MDRLKGKVAIITGAGRGLGEAGAKEFISKGMCVVLADKHKIDSQKLEKLFGYDCEENIFPFSF